MIIILCFLRSGRCAVSYMLSLSDNVTSLLPFIEPRGSREHDNKLAKSSVSSRYAAVLLLQLLQSESAAFRGNFFSFIHQQVSIYSKLLFCITNTYMDALQMYYCYATYIVHASVLYSHRSSGWRFPSSVRQQTVERSRVF